MTSTRKGEEMWQGKGGGGENSSCGRHTCNPSKKVFHTVRDEHHDGGREDADPDEEVREPEGEDELVGDGAELGRRQHGNDDESVAELKKKEEAVTHILRQ